MEYEFSADITSFFGVTWSEYADLVMEIGCAA